jgi:hypothetical protein
MACCFTWRKKYRPMRHHDLTRNRWKGPGQYLGMQFAVLRMESLRLHGRQDQNRWKIA